MKARRLSLVAVVSLLVAVCAAEAAPRRAVPDALFDRASAAGSARVIVRLNAAFSPEAETLSAAHAAVQRQDIAAVRAALKTQLRAERHIIVREYEALPFLALEAGPDALALLEALSGLVVRVEEDRVHRMQLAHSVPLVQAPQAWAAGADGSGTIVAILDTGVQKTHPFLAGKVIAEACFSSNTTHAGFTVTSVCPGGVTSSTAPGSGANCSVLDCNHGTHVAGIVAGGTTGVSGSGVAPGARLMAIQVFSRFPGAHPLCGGVPCVLSFESDQLAALNHVFNQRNAFPGRRIAAINMSLGSGVAAEPCPSDPLTTPIAQLRTAGIATVIAAGNEGFTDAIAFPSCVPEAISVGSTGDGSAPSAPVDVVSGFSNMASFMSLLAPGELIRSSVPIDAFATFRGTSMAAPHVAGAFAILREANPAASVDTFLDALQTTGEVVTDHRPVCDSCEANAVTSHRINVKDALDVVAVRDVAVVAATTAGAVSPGATIVVEATIRNVGPVAVGAFTVSYYLSSNGTFDESSDVLLGTRTIASLGPGKRNVKPKTLTIPASVDIGRYRILVVVDSQAVLAEASERNNVRATAPIVVGMDIAVTAVTTAGAAAPGEAIAVNAIIRNTGSEPTGSFLVRYHLSTNGTFDARDVFLDRRKIAALAVGADVTASKTVVIPPGTSPGTYRIIVRADTGNALTEANEDNNLRATARMTVGP